MSLPKELGEMRRKEVRTLVADLDRERRDFAKDRIAVQLGKLSKTHQVAQRKLRIARMLTVLSEKLHQAPSAVAKKEPQ